MRRCLIVSPHFPPSTLAGVHRARHLAKHLPAHGWRPTILCVDPKYHIERLDPALAALVPPDVEIVRTGAVPAGFSRLFGVAGDIGLRAYFHLRAALEREMARGHPDVVLITGSPYYPMLLADHIRRRWQVPVVLDFQDPWVSRTGVQAPPWSKAALSHRLARTLEPHVVRSAAFITSVSDRQNDEMATRYPSLHLPRMAGIPIGGDPEDFETLRSASGQIGEAGPHLAADKINISYVGTVWPPVVATLSAVLQGMVLLHKRAPRVATRIRLNFVGTTANPLDTHGLRVMPLARQLGLADSVYEVAERRPYLEALQLMAQTNVILMIGSDEPHYTASKIYPSLMAGRPFISIFHRLSSAHDVLTKAGGGLALAFETPGELDALVPAIAAGLEKLATEPDAFGRPDPEAYAPYTANAVAGRFAHVFNTVAA